MRILVKSLIVILLIGWLSFLKHFYILPRFDEEKITGFEINVRWKF